MASASSTNSWILSLKTLLISTAVVSVAVTMKLTVPLMLNGLPAIWSVVVTCFKPPYLYVVINGIILTIAASTRFQQENQSQSQQQVNYNSPNTPPPSDLTSDLPPVSNPPIFGVTEPIVTVEPPVVYESKQSDVDLETVAEVVGENEDEFVTTRSTWIPSLESDINSPPHPKEVEPEFSFPVKEKQPVTSRFAHNRKPAKPSPEGARALRVLKPKKHETLESTWKMITDGRQLPLTRHLRKSDNFDNLRQDSDESTATAKTKVVKKSETFKERTTYADQNDYPQPSATNSSPAVGGKLKKDVSLGQDELNRRVEAFIKKFNDDMRLQRQESLKQYMEMVNRGAR
ncbi:hypothetical protein L1987_58596 [Smallanthus sonchifolius]|uniref:Uncharacterized protein n=1 Tax=Smallanthus sonchifolius TaxID=185202 RepID=A0ACB9DGR5_9ASTR|nr:hypothetical protein L1987_58596 [Smallanthus sonchifolius]